MKKWITRFIDKHYRLLLVVAFLLALLFSTVLLNLKYQSLAYHNIDFPYFAQFAARLADPHLDLRIALNPEGINLFGMSGTEADLSFHRSIHFEPLKYIYALPYWLGGLPGVFLFLALVFFSPILYLASLIQQIPIRDRSFYLSLVLLYLSMPAIWFTLADDLRVRMFLAPFWFLTVLSIHFRRPVHETLLFFLFFMFVREEALLIGVVLLVYVWLDGYSNPEMQDWTRFGWIVAIYFGSIFIYAFYFFYAAYPLAAWASWPARLLTPTGMRLIGGASLGLLIIGIIWAKISASRKVLQTLVLYAAALPILYDYLSRVDLVGQSSFGALFSADGLQQMILSPRVGLLIVFLLIACIPIGPAIRKQSTRSVLLVVAGLLIGAGFLYQLVYYAVWLPETCLKAEQANLVFDLREKTDPHDSILLTDYATYQAFHDYNVIYIYERLPAYKLADATRYYPNNRERVLRLLQEEVDWFVVSMANQQTAESLLKDAGLTPLDIRSNSAYIYYQITP